MMEDNNLDGDILLDMIAKSLGGEIIIWNNMEEVVKSQICVDMIINTIKSKEEKRRLRRKGL